MRRRVVVTGVGSVNAAFAGGWSALAAFLAEPRSGVSASAAYAAPVAEVASETLASFIEGGEARRLSRVCQMTVAAGRLAMADAGLSAGERVGLVIGTEFGDLRSTIEFADGYLTGGPPGLSPLLFPNTVMNTMAASTTIAVAAKGPSLTLNAPTVAGELAVAHAASAIAAGRADAVLAGGVDQLDPAVADMLDVLGAPREVQGEGATFVVLESSRAAEERGATVLGEVAGVAWRTLPARPYAIGRSAPAGAVGAALEAAGGDRGSVGWVYTSASGDVERDAWEARVLDAAVGPPPPPRVALRLLLGQHAGAGALSVAAAVWTAQSGRLPTPAVQARPAGAPPRPGLVHALARGGDHVALVVRAPAPE